MDVEADTERTATVTECRHACERLRWRQGQELCRRAELILGQCSGALIATSAAVQTRSAFPFANSRTGHLAISFREARSMRVLRLNSIETSALPETRGNVLRRNDVCDKVTVDNDLSAASEC